MIRHILYLAPVKWIKRKYLIEIADRQYQF